MHCHQCSTTILLIHFITGPKSQTQRCTVSLYSFVHFSKRRTIYCSFIFIIIHIWHIIQIVHGVRWNRITVRPSVVFTLFDFSELFGRIFIRVVGNNLAVVISVILVWIFDIVSLVSHNP
uniref:Uncharacterized protein n=1 Tax=Strigamia maritima TaxID=126957 RepID=T1IYJ8_STRMM